MPVCDGCVCSDLPYACPAVAWPLPGLCEPERRARYRATLRHACLAEQHPAGTDRTGAGRVPASPAPAPTPLPAPTHAGVPDLSEWAYVTGSRLLEDTRRLYEALPPDIDGVAAIARSGLLPGAPLATWLHVPIWTVDQHAGMVRDVGHGVRLLGRDPAPPRHVLLIDDTAASGRAMAAAGPVARAAWPDARLTRAVVYAHPTALAAGVVDLYGARYPGNHYLEWNWANAGHGAGCGYDIDGILVPDGRPDVPLFVPRRTAVPLIATGRPESHRGATEAMLGRLGVRWRRLAMFGGRYGVDAVPHEAIARFKAQEYGASDCALFAESEPVQAAIINELTGRPVLCPAAGRVFPPRPATEPAAVERMRRLAKARTCPDRAEVGSHG